MKRSDRELLEDAIDLMCSGSRANDLIKEIRARLAEPEDEPVAWGVMKRGERVWYVNDSRFTCRGYAEHYQHIDASGSDQNVIPLYRRPPRQLVRLSEDEISDLAREMVKGDKSVNWLARAIESAMLGKNK